MNPGRRGALAVDDRGFVRTDEQLRSVSHPQVFATGDCASWPGHALPKAGVHAVRMGPVLANNLRAALGGSTLPQAFSPQRRFLALLATSGASPQVRRLPLGNLVFKLSGALIAIPLLPLLHPWLQQWVGEVHQQVVVFHLVFNIALATLFVGFTGLRNGNLSLDIPRLTFMILFLVPVDNMDGDAAAAN